MTSSYHKLIQLSGVSPCCFSVFTSALDKSIIIFVSDAKLI